MNLPEHFAETIQPGKSEPKIPRKNSHADIIERRFAKAAKRLEKLSNLDTRQQRYASMLKVVTDEVNRTCGKEPRRARRKIARRRARLAFRTSQSTGPRGRSLKKGRKE